jgi:hypothetical protein
MAEAIVLDAALEELLSDDAQREDRSLNDLVNEAVEYYIRQRQQKKIDVEIVAFESMHRDLWQNYPKEWVAIHHQELVDHDSDQVALYRRVRQRFGRIPVLIRQVQESPTVEIWMRTPSTGRLTV